MTPTYLRPVAHGQRMATQATIDLLAERADLHAAVRILTAELAAEQQTRRNTEWALDEVTGR